MLRKTSLIVCIAIASLFGSFAQSEEAKWVKSGTSGELPVDTVGTLGGRPGNVCRYLVREQQNKVHLGVTTIDSCYVIASFGLVFKIPLAISEVLVLKNQNWQAVTNSKLPENAFVGSIVDGKPLQVCRATVQNQVRIGSVSLGTCSIVDAQMSLSKLTNYEVLMLPEGQVNITSAPTVASELRGSTATPTTTETTTTPTATVEAKWVLGSVPTDATLVGTSAGRPMNICRMKMANGELHVGKAWNGNCYVGFGKLEVKGAMTIAEALVLAKASWVSVTDGKIPETAFQASTSAGKPMYVCRSKVPNGESHAGKLWSGTCYIGYGGNELSFTNYEVMTTPTATVEAKWVLGSVPTDATLVGTSAGRPMNICRMKMANGELHVGKAWNGNCYVGFGKLEVKGAMTIAEALVLAKASWVSVTDGKTPETAFQASTSAGKPMYVCRSKVPNGESHAGKLWSGTCYVSYGGNELSFTSYEVMTVTK